MISAFLEDPSAMEDDGPKERWLRRQDPDREGDLKPPPAGTEIHDFGIIVEDERRW